MRTLPALTRYYQGGIFILNYKKMNTYQEKKNLIFVQKILNLPGQLKTCIQNASYFLKTLLNITPDRDYALRDPEFLDCSTQSLFRIPEPGIQFCGLVMVIISPI